MFVIVFPKHDQLGIHYAAKDTDIPPRLQKIAELHDHPVSEIVAFAKVGRLNTRTSRHGEVEGWKPAEEIVQITCGLIPQEKVSSPEREAEAE
jgi:hypothetical protein